MGKIELLNKLKDRNKVLKLIVMVGFKTDKELDDYRATIKLERNEYYDNLEKIETLEWELLSKEEQDKILENRRLMKLKREGKLF